MKFPKQINVPISRRYRLQCDLRPNCCVLVLQRHTYSEHCGWWYRKYVWVGEIPYPWPPAIRRHREWRTWRRSEDLKLEQDQAEAMHRYGGDKVVPKHAASRQKAEA